jgi:hypothetical protein
MNGPASYPPTSCRKCGRTDANWIVSRLGCGHCFDPFATAAQLKALERVAEVAADVAAGRRSVEELRSAVDDWRGG